jgi:hypothetical protein
MRFESKQRRRRRGGKNIENEGREFQRSPGTISDG